MAINPAKLIAAAMLQDLLVDKDGTPMANGTITCYHDNSRTTLKNWYYQTGTPGAYTYIALPNPLTLSAAGTISDLNGVDTIPFFYPFDEVDQNTSDPYYITIVNAAQTNQITRANFPFIPAGGGNISTLNSFNNLIINNGFWRNFAPNSLNITPFNTINLQTATSGTSPFNLIIAPSQHDGFRYPDIQYFTTTQAGTDVLTFTPFPLALNQPIANTISPEYYINHACSATGSGVKYYQFPISLHVNTLEGVPFTGSIQAQNAGSVGIITISILQDTGSGTTAPVPTIINSFTLTPGWATYTFNGIFPSTQGLTLGNGADDALYLLVGLPSNTTFTINFTKPSLFLTTNVLPSNDFQTYDQVDSIINSPRTGDLRTSINSFYPYGWIPMNGGSIGNGASMATTRSNADSWQLFNLLWTLFSPYASGTSNLLGQLVTGGSTPVAYGVSSYADFNANKAIVLTQTMGKVLLGTVPISAMLNVNKTTFTGSAFGGNQVITTANSVNFFNGMPIIFTGGSLPAAITANTLYFVGNFNGTNSFTVATSFANYLTGTYVAAVGPGTGSGTVIGSVSGSFEGEYNHLLTLSELISHSHNPLAPNTGFWESVVAGGAFGINAGAPANANPAATTGDVTNLPTQTLLNVTQPGTFMNIYIKL